MNYKSKFIHLIGAIICFVLFVIGMIFSERIASLMVVGIIGLSGFSYFAFRVVLSMMDSSTSD